MKEEEEVVEAPETEKDAALAQVFLSLSEALKEGKEKKEGRGRRPRGSPTISVIFSRSRYRHRGRNKSKGGGGYYEKNYTKASGVAATMNQHD
jgi:hypothetical protein